MGPFHRECRHIKGRSHFTVHRFLLDLACCRSNLQLGITENPQRGELLSKCLNFSCEWWKAGWIKDRNIWVSAQCLPFSSSDGFEGVTKSGFLIYSYKMEITIPVLSSSLWCCEGYTWKTFFRFSRSIQVQRFLFADQIFLFSFPNCLPVTAQDAEV